MNRELKFRVWDARNKKMIYQDLLFDIADGYELARPSGKHKDLNPLNVTIMQYTGLKDRNGVEIYEGDIIRTKLESPSMFLGDEEEPYENVSIGKVVFDCGAFQSSADDLNIDYYDEIEVIGNIFESPDLISGKEPGEGE